MAWQVDRPGWTTLSRDKPVGLALLVGEEVGQQPRLLLLTLPAPHTLHPTPYTLHPTPYTLHPTPYTLHPTFYTLHPTPYTITHKPVEGGVNRGLSLAPAIDVK